MRIGHLFLQPVRDGESHAGRIRQTIEMTRSMEAHGFDVAVFCEAHFSEHAASPNPLLLATAVGQHTERIDLATGIVVLGLWHPIRLAEDIAIADQLLEGRLEVCVGYGSHARAYDGLGIPFEERRSRHAEALEILLLAWSRAEFEYQGRHHRIAPAIRVLPDPYTSPHPRLMLSAASEPSIRAAAATDLRVFGHQSVTTDAAGRSSWAHEIYLDERRRLGRAGDFWSSSINRRLVVVDSAAPSEWGRRRSEVQRRTADGPASSSDDDNIVFGTPDEVLEQVRFLRDVVGVTEINFVTEFGAIPIHDAHRMIELFGTEVLPALRSDEGAGQ